MPEEIKIVFTKEKETKNTVRFTEAPVDGQAPYVGTLYLQKWFAGDTKEVDVRLIKK